MVEGDTVRDKSPAAGGVVDERGEPLEHSIRGDGPEKKRAVCDPQEIVSEMGEHGLLIGEPDARPIIGSRSAIPHRAMRLNNR